jgi:hypothetical protein
MYHHQPINVPAVGTFIGINRQMLVMIFTFWNQKIFCHFSIEKKTTAELGNEGAISVMILL